MFEFRNLTQNICCGCLTIGENIQIMSPEEMDLYKTCINEMSSDLKTEVYLCNMCTYLIKKFNKFMKQCQKAYSILNNCLIEDNKIGVYGLKLVCNLTKSNVTSLEFIDYNRDIDTLESVDIFDDSIDVDEEDIPLVMLKTDEDSTKYRTAEKRARKCKIQGSNGEAKANKNFVNQDSNINHLERENKNTNLNQSNGEEKKKLVGIEIKLKQHRKGKKKTLRDGFTSRMVQETDEYTVIKLSKEQVLEEMEEKSKSDEYLRSLYKCEKCVKGFNFEDVLKTHMERHVKKKGWLLCDLCRQYCPSVISLRGHMKSHTTRYKCKVCSCVRLSRQVLLEHHATRHTGDARQYTCQLCEFVSNKRTSMQRHVRTRHNKTEKHPCEQCGKTLNNLEALRVHTARHDKSKRVKCDECDRWFVYPSLLHQHKMAVHVRDDYYCVECDVKFKSRENLSLHFKRTKRHRDVSTFRYACPYCPKRFMYASALSGHQASAHCVRDALAEATLVCTQCRASFARKSLLRAHMRTHASEPSLRTFACECGATFSQQDTLAAHALEKHHKKNEENPLQNQIPTAQNDDCAS